MPKDQGSQFLWWKVAQTCLGLENPTTRFRSGMGRVWVRSGVARCESGFGGMVW